MEATLFAVPFSTNWVYRFEVRVSTNSEPDPSPSKAHRIGAKGAIYLKQACIWVGFAGNWFESLPINAHQEKSIDGHLTIQLIDIADNKNFRPAVTRGRRLGYCHCRFLFVFGIFFCLRLDRPEKLSGLLPKELVQNLKRGFSCVVAAKVPCTYIYRMYSPVLALSAWGP